MYAVENFVSDQKWKTLQEPVPTGYIVHNIRDELERGRAIEQSPERLLTAPSFKELLQPFTGTYSPIAFRVAHTFMWLGWKDFRWKWEDLIMYNGNYYLPKCYVCHKSYIPEKVRFILHSLM